MLLAVKEISEGIKAHIPREDCDSYFTMSKRDLWNFWKWNGSILRWNEIEPLLDNLRVTLATFFTVEVVFMHEIFELLYEISLGIVFFITVPYLCYRMHQINRSYFLARLLSGFIGVIWLYGYGWPSLWNRSTGSSLHQNQKFYFR